MRCSLPVMIALAAAATPAGAAILESGASFLGEYTDNANDLGGGAVSVEAYGLTLSPWVRLESEEGGRLRYQIRYETSFRRRFSVTDTDDLDHILRLRAAYDLDSKTVVRFQQGTDALRDLVRNVRSQAGQPLTDQVPDIFGREQRLRMNFTLSVDRQLDRNTTATLSATHNRTESSDERRFDSSSTSLLFNLNRQVTEKLRLGMGASATFQEAESTRTSRGSSTDFFRASASFNYAISESLVLSGNGGPLFVMPEDRDTFAAGAEFGRRRFPIVFDENGDPQPVDPFSCPVEEGLRFFEPLECEPLLGIPPLARRFLTAGGRSIESTLDAAQAAKQSESRGSVTLGAELALTKTWRHARALMRLSRRAGTSSELGTSTVSDTAWLELSWTPDRDWKFTLTGIVNRQDSTNELLLLRPVITPQVLRPFGIVVAESSGFELLAESESVADRTSFRMRARVERVLRQRLFSFVEVTWRDQEFENQRLAGGRDFQGIQVLVGLSYRIAPRLLRLPF